MHGWWFVGLIRQKSLLLAMPEPAMVTPVRHPLHEGTIEVKFNTSFCISANSGGNPRSVDQMMAALLRHFRLGGIILGVVHWSGGPVGVSGGG
jgi:hypothetical protein